MTGTDLTLLGDSPFDAIRREDERGEYWSARDLMPLLGYAKWERFDDVIDRARISMTNVGQDADREASRRREAFGSTRQLGDNYRLTRHACYVVAMNGDVRKSEIAAAQAYFAAKTREAETRPAVRELSRRELAEYWARAESDLEAERAKVAELEPAAASWEALAEASGDYSMRETAQILNRDPSISTGQNRLSRYLKSIGWVDDDGTPYQRHVDLGRLLLRMYTDRQEVLRRQIRITAKGVHELHRLLGGTGAVLLEVAS